MYNKINFKKILKIFSEIPKVGTVFALSLSLSLYNLSLLFSPENRRFSGQSNPIVAGMCRNAAHMAFPGGVMENVKRQ